MKNFIIAGLLVLLGWYAWRYYTKKPDIITNTKIQHVLSSERYGQSLRAIADTVFAPLDTKAPNPVAQLTKLSASADVDARSGDLTTDEAELVKRICTSLTKANRERESYETEYGSALNRGYGSFQGRKGEKATRQFFLDEILRKWLGAAQQHRRVVESDLATLRGIERQREHRANL